MSKTFDKYLLINIISSLEKSINNINPLFLNKDNIKYQYYKFIDEFPDLMKCIPNIINYLLFDIINDNNSNIIFNTLKILFDNDYNIELSDHFKNLIYKNNLSIKLIKLLIDNKLDINETDKYGRNLHINFVKNLI